MQDKISVAKFHNSTYRISNINFCSFYYPTYWLFSSTISGEKIEILLCFLESLVRQKVVDAAASDVHAIYANLC